MSSRRGAGPLRGIEAHFVLLRAVAAAGLLAVLDAGRVERAADDLVADTRQVLHTAAAHEHDRVLLQVVAVAGDVGRDLDAAREADAGDLAQRRVRLLRGGGVDAGAHAAALRRALQGRRLRSCRTWSRGPCGPAAGSWARAPLRAFVGARAGHSKRRRRARRRRAHGRRSRRCTGASGPTGKPAGRARSTMAADGDGRRRRAPARVRHGPPRSRRSAWSADASARPCRLRAGQSPRAAASRPPASGSSAPSTRDGRGRR